jgi:hypothetical protein
VNPDLVRAIATLRWLARWGEVDSRAAIGTALHALAVLLGVDLPVCRPQAMDPSARELVGALASVATAASLLPDAPAERLGAARLLQAWLTDEIRPQVLARAGWRRCADRPDRWIDPQDIARECDERGAFFRVLKDYAAAERLRAAG